jgi:hypothetical protein
MAGVILQESYQTQGLYLGPETNYAEVVAANRRILSVEAPFKMEIESETFTPSGDTAPSLVVINDEYTTVDASGKPDFEAFPYFASSLWGEAVSVTDLTGAYEWLFQYDGRTPLSPISYTALYGSVNRAYQCAGLIWTKYNMTVNRGGIDFGAMAIAKQLEKGHKAFPRNEIQTVSITGSAPPTGGTFTLTYSGQTTAGIAYNANAAAVQSALEALSNIAPGEVAVTGGPGPSTAWIVEFSGGTLDLTDVVLMTGSAASLTGGTGNAMSIAETQKGGVATDVDAKAMFPGHFDIFMDPSWATLGTTKLLYCYDFEIETPERIARTRPINSTKSSDGLVETEDQELTVTLTMGVDETMEEMVDSLRAGDKLFFRLDANGGVIGASNDNYLARHDMCIILNETEDFQAQDGVLVVPISGVLARDNVSGLALEAKFRNSLAAL